MGIQTTFGGNTPLVLGRAYQSWVNIGQRDVEVSGETVKLADFGLAREIRAHGPRVHETAMASGTKAPVKFLLLFFSLGGSKNGSFRRQGFGKISSALLAEPRMFVSL